jgi:hypothetical protein
MKPTIKVELEVDAETLQGIAIHLSMHKNQLNAYIAGGLCPSTKVDEHRLRLERLETSLAALREAGERMVQGRPN